MEEYLGRQEEEGDKMGLRNCMIIDIVVSVSVSCMLSETWKIFCL